MDLETVDPANVEHVDGWHVYSWPELGEVRGWVAPDVFEVDGAYQRAVGDWRDTDERFPAGPQFARPPDHRCGLHPRSPEGVRSARRPRSRRRAST